MTSFLLKISFCLILFITGFIHAQECLPNSERLFRSEIAVAHRTAMQTYAKELLQKFPLLANAWSKPLEGTFYQYQGLRLIQQLHLPMEEGTHSRRAWHQQFTRTLRVLTLSIPDENPLSKEISAFVEAFTIWYFSEMDLGEAYSKALQREMGWKESASFDAAKMVEEIYDKQKNISSCKGSIKEAYLTDTLLDGNFPSIVWRYESRNKKVNILRCGTMVRDLESVGPLSCKVTEEFVYYLKAQQRRGKKHLYINTMTHGPGKASKMLGDVPRTEALKTLEIDPMVNQAFRLISLDKESPFYFQDAPFRCITHVAEFKRLLFGHLFKADGNFYWPKELQNEAWKERVSLILNEVQERYFKGKENLTPQERCHYIEIVYTKIIEAALDMMSIDVANISCRNCIDRGATLIGIFCLRQLIDKQKASSQEIFKTLSYVFGPALFLRNRPAYDYRIEILKGTVSLLQRPINAR